MLLGPAGCDDRITEIAALLQPPLRIAVVGAHLTGQPLNHQLRSLGAQLVAATRTAPAYRLFALDTEPAKPGLVRVPEGGAAVEAELWELSPAALGHFTAALPRPMTLGSVELADGATAPGFLCEPQALATARDITSYGGWRAYLSASRP
jgi:allophanate hydrolase